MSKTHRSRAGEPVAICDQSALILARRGQGLFKQRVRQVEMRCRITGVDRIEHLRASDERKRSVANLDAGTKRQFDQVYEAILGLMGTSVRQ
jgi:hypothetical protein